MMIKNHKQTKAYKGEIVKDEDDGENENYNGIEK